MAFRFFLQPAFATFLACRDGIRAARKGNPAYPWALFAWSGHRRELLREGWRSVGRVFTMAVAIDLIYEAFVLRAFVRFKLYSLGVLLGVLPYVFCGGLSTDSPGSPCEENTQQSSALLRLLNLSPL
jgi:hypothetical protein